MSVRFVLLNIMPVKYTRTEVFKKVKFENFQQKKIDIFNMLAQNIESVRY